jgi:putative peptide zinc metalloprotease protein
MHVKKYNCDVPEMGVNLIFFYPLAYTDVSSSIVLAPQERLVVSTAGIRFELYLAIIAGFFWFFCSDDSIIKNLLFFIAAISWTLTLLINIMPFMRFDGYYILSDYLRIRNLGPRSAAVFKYYYRKIFLGINSALPEDYDRKKFKFLLIFAILAKIYRVFIFTSILLFLYYTQFIGSALFVLGIFLMLILPMATEIYNILKLYKSQKKAIKSKNMRITICVTLAALILFFLPFGNYIYLPAVLHAKIQRMYTPFSSRVDEINIGIGQEVKSRDQLLK